MAASHGPVVDKGMWWLSPFWLIIGFLIPLFVAIMMLGESDSRALTVRGYRFLDLRYCAIGLSLIALMATIALVGEKIELKGHGSILERPWRNAAWTLGTISLLAYIIWFREILFSPATLFGILTGTVRMSRSDFGRTVGLSSFVNFMPIFFALMSHVWARKPEAVTKGLRILAISLFALTLLRVYVWAERLALIEAAVAIVVPYICVRQSVMSPARRRLLLLAPLFGFPLVLGYFGFTEYFRSWQSDFYQGKMPFWEFIAGRFASYYYTSLNNGAGLLATQDWPTYKLENTLQFALKAPSIFGALYRYYSEIDGLALGYFMQKYADPEFNNPSGVFSILFELGPIGAITYFCALGMLVGVLYRSMLSNQARGVVLYPMSFVMMLELYRYPYFGSSRAFTAFLGAMLALYLLSRRTQKTA